MLSGIFLDYKYDEGKPSRTYLASIRNNSTGEFITPYMWLTDVKSNLTKGDVVEFNTDYKIVRVVKNESDNY